MIPVVVAAQSAVARAGLRAIVEELPDFEVVEAISPAALAGRASRGDPGIVLWQLSPDEDATATLAAFDGAPVLVLAQHPSLDVIRAGAAGVLAVDATPEQIAAGLRAAALDVLVVAPEALRPQAASAVPSTLTARETEVLRMIAAGLANKEIAHRLGISEHTVKFHVSSLLGKLRAGTRAEAIAMGIRQGMVLL